MAEIYNFFGDIWDYLRETYFCVDFGSYEHFNTVGFSATLSQVIIGAMLGCCLAAIFIAYERSYLGRLVRALLSREAQDRESALTLAELGFAKSGLIKHALRRRDSALRKLVHHTAEEEPPVPDAADATQKTEKPTEKAAATTAYAAEKATATITEPAGTAQAADVTQADDTEAPAAGKEKPAPLRMTEIIDFAATRFYIPTNLRDRAAIRYHEKGSSLRTVLLAMLVALVGGGLLIRFLPVLFRMADGMMSWLA